MEKQQESLPSRKKKFGLLWPVLIMLALTVLLLLLIVVRVIVKHNELAPMDSINGQMDFGFLNLASDGCHLTDPGGQSVKEKLLASSANKTVIIPEGTVITGDCFIRKSNVISKGQK